MRGNRFYKVWETVLFLKTKKDVFSGTNSLLVQVWAKCIESESMLATVSVTNPHWFNNLISLNKAKSVSFGTVSFIVMLSFPNNVLFHLKQRNLSETMLYVEQNSNESIIIVVFSIVPVESVMENMWSIWEVAVTNQNSQKDPCQKILKEFPL